MLYLAKITRRREEILVSVYELYKDTALITYMGDRVIITEWVPIKDLTPVSPPASIDEKWGLRG